MAGSILGNIFKISTWGESHGKAVGVVVDGCPAGLELSNHDIQLFLNRRKPGQSRYATPRQEDDHAEILAGVFEGRTTGTPISIMIENTQQRSGDYSAIANYYRPGHADLTFDLKYGFRDYRGGGRSSGRETIGRVAAGAVAAKLLGQLGVSLCTYTLSIGPVTSSSFDAQEIPANPLYMPDKAAAEKAGSYLDQCIKNQNSAGGIIECRVNNLPPGLGDPVFEKLSANLAKAIMSIGAVKGFEIGDGLSVAAATGLSNNDPLAYRADGKIAKLSNHSGGLLGGISDGSELILRAAVKPTPSIAASQQTVSKNGENININITGRHDPIIVPRAVVVVEAMTALTLADALLMNMTARMDHLLQIYR